MGAGHSSSKTVEHLKHKPGHRRSLVTSGWRKRQLPAQIFGVIRHTERADCFCGLYGGERWTQTEDFKNWPVDPPLSDAGLEGANDIGHLVQDFVLECGSPIHVVITSPYHRCVQTAAQICRELGPSARMIVDLSLGEVFGPDIMGDSEPSRPTRPFEDIKTACQSCGIKCLSKTIGKWPTWPEDLHTARRRFGDRFLTYLQRSATARRNFLLVTHADCVGAALSLMPSQADQFIGKVDYGGLFLARRKPTTTSSRRASSGPVAVKSTPLPMFHRRATVPSFLSVSPMTPPSPSPDQEHHAGCTSDNENGIMDELAACDLLPPALKRDLWMVEKDPASQTASGSGLSSDEDMPAWKEPEPPKVSDGWQVQTHNMTLHRKPNKKSNVKSAFSKKLQSFTKNSRFSKEQIELLLGEMPSKSLGVNASDLEKVGRLPSKNSTTSKYSDRMPIPTFCSFSTYLFGASDTSSIDALSDGGSFSFSPSDVMEIMPINASSMTQAERGPEKTVSVCSEDFINTLSKVDIVEKRRQQVRSVTSFVGERRNVGGKHKLRKPIRSIRSGDDDVATIATTLHSGEDQSHTPRRKENYSKSLGAVATSQLRLSERLSSAERWRSSERKRSSERDSLPARRASMPAVVPLDVHTEVEEATSKCLLLEELASEGMLGDEVASKVTPKPTLLPFKDCTSSLIMKRRSSLSPKNDVPGSLSPVGGTPCTQTMEGATELSVSPSTTPTHLKDCMGSLIMKRRASLPPKEGTASLGPPARSVHSEPKMEASEPPVQTPVGTPTHFKDCTNSLLMQRRASLKSNKIAGSSHNEANTPTTTPHSPKTPKTPKSAKICSRVEAVKEAKLVSSLVQVGA